MVGPKYDGSFCAPPAGGLSDFALLAAAGWCAEGLLDAVGARANPCPPNELPVSFVVVAKLAGRDAATAEAAAFKAVGSGIADILLIMSDDRNPADAPPAGVAAPGAAGLGAPNEEGTAAPNVAPKPDPPKADGAAEVAAGGFEGTG